MESLVDKIILLKIPEESASFCSCKELNKSVTTDLKFLLAFLAIQLCCLIVLYIFSSLHLLLQTQQWNHHNNA